jgi:hypothetical protein
MATSAPRKTQPRKAADQTEGHSPARWWQWLLIYPTLALSLVAAAPDWIDKFRAPAGAERASDADKQNRLWQKNAACAALPFKGFLNPSNIAVDATICNSGDILVHAVTPDNAQIYKWFGLDDVLPRAIETGPIPSAHAATLTTLVSPPFGTVQQPSFRLAQFQVNVICQRFNGRYLTRRISTPQGCFDEVIDTYNGAVVSRNPAPSCAPQC